MTKVENMPPGSRWKNRFVSSKFYDKEVGVSIIGQRNKKTNKSDELNESELSKVKRRRAVDLHFLANVLFCSLCKTALSLDNIDKENLHEVDSIITRRCQKCIFFETILSWKTHTNRIDELPKSINESDPSSKTISSDPCDTLNHRSVEKFLRTMKVPYMTSRTYVKYEYAVGPVVESVLKENCKKIV